MDTVIYMQGNLASDPTQKVVAEGTRLTRFRLAASGRRFDQTLRDWVSTDPVYMTVTCWRQLGDNVMKSLHKGDTVIVLGRLRFREYEDVNGGPRRQSYEIDASSVGPDLSRYATALTRPLRELPSLDGDVPPAGEVPVPAPVTVPAQTNPWNEQAPAEPAA